jgi:hypothetical protein
LLVEVSLVAGSGAEEQRNAAIDQAALAVKDVVTDVGGAHPGLRIEQVGDATWTPR